jgi:ketosteroid isomerase-like protein
MKRVLSLAVCVAIVVLVISTRQVSGADDIRAQIEAANRGFEAAFGRGDANGVAACYTVEAQLLPPGSEPVSGTQAIAAFWGGAMESGGAGVKLHTLEAEQHGETAVEVGRAEILGADGASLDTVKYIVIWKRVGGQWKLHRDIWNSSAPAS